MKMIWKEWKQQRWLLLFGSLAGLVFPIFEAISNITSNGQFNIESGSIAVSVCGAFFGIILAVATTSNDAVRGVDDFWQSKPVKVWKVFTYKWIVAAAGLFAVFIVVLSLDFVSDMLRDGFPRLSWSSFCLTYPIALMLFAVAMFLVVVLRDAAKAVLLAIWFGLLVYFLPLLLNCLRWLNIFEQLERSTYRVSLLRYFIGKSGLSGFLVKYGMVKWPRGNPFPFLSRDWKHAVWQIISSSEYLQYLLFFGFCLALTVIFLVLTNLAFKRKWLWQPGQKTIAWVLGLSAVFIFSVAMFQAGHNLEYATMLNGRNVVSKISLWDKAEHEYNWTGEDIGDDSIDRQGRRESAACVQGELFFRISTASQISQELLNTIRKNDPNFPRLNWETPLKQHFLLDIYRFPYADEKVHLSQTSFFATNLIARKYGQYILGCFSYSGRLYVSYLPMLFSQIGVVDPDLESKVRLLVVDITYPNEPRRVIDKEVSSVKSYYGGSIARYDQYFYINDKNRLMIFSLKNPDDPVLLNSIDNDNFKQETGRHLGNFDRMQVVSDKLILQGRSEIILESLSDPVNPQQICHISMLDHLSRYSDDYIGAVCYRDNLLYVATQTGLFVFSISQDEDGIISPELIGRRKATPIERFAGRNPAELVLHDNMLIENARGFGLLIYEISDPTLPRRVFHGETSSFMSDSGLWNGLIYAIDYYNTLVLFQAPK